jgi:hypothetical protein
MPIDDESQFLAAHGMLLRQADTPPRTPQYYSAAARILNPGHAQLLYSTDSACL